MLSVPDQRPSQAVNDTCADLGLSLSRRLDYLIAVAGMPITHVAEATKALDRSRFEWAINEKVAAEAAVGLSAAGRRVGVLVKHNGLDLALDPLMNAAVHTVGGALIVVSGDDPDASSSTCIQDSRLVARLAGISVLEPAGDGDIDRLIDLAVQLSEQARMPLLVRITTRLHRACESGASITPTAVRRPFTSVAPTHGTQHIDTALAHGLTKLGRQQRRRLAMEQLNARLAQTVGVITEECAPACATGVVAVGAAAAVLPAQECCRLVVRTGVPAPQSVVDFVDRHETAIVAEEPAPVLEEWLLGRVSRRDSVLGRLTGHLRPEGSLIASDLAKLLAVRDPRAWTEIQRKPAAVQPPSTWHVLFHAISRLRRQGAFVATDVGSSVNLCYPPYAGADVALCLGSAIAVAGGAARAGRRCIAVTGDYALLHSGIEGLLSATERNLPLLILVLVNGRQAKTGGQPLPRANVEELVRACGITATDRWKVSSMDVKATTDRLSKLISAGAPTLAYVEAM